MHLMEEGSGSAMTGSLCSTPIQRTLPILIWILSSAVGIQTAIAASVTPLHCLSSTSPGAPNCAVGPSPGSTPDEQLGHRYVGNPIDVVTGNKYQREDDFLSLAGDLAFIRHYNSSLDAYDTGLGPGWRHTYQVVLSKVAEHQLQIIQSDGRAIAFTRVEGTSIPTVYKSDVATDGILIVGTETRWYVPDGRQFQFHGSLLVAITSMRSHARLSLHYRDRRLDRVTDQYGQTLNFEYGDPQDMLPDYGAETAWSPPGALTHVTLPDQSTIEYRYDRFRRLTAVAYPDEQTREQSTHYAYDNLDYINRLTARRSTIDNRNSSWSYDEQGRAQSWSEHGRDSGLSINYAIADTEQAYSGAIVTYGDDRVERYHWKKQSGSAEKDLTTSVYCASCSEPYTIGFADSHYESTSAKAERMYGGEYTLSLDYGSDNRWNLRLSESNNNTEMTVSVDRLGKVKDLQIGKTTLSALAGASLNGSLHKCVPANAENTPITPALARLAQLSKGATACSEDLFPLLDLVNELEKGSSDSPFSSISDTQPSSRRIPTRPRPIDHFCTMPSGKSCNDLYEDRDMAELSHCTYANTPCRGSFQQVNPLSIGLAHDKFNSNGFNAVLYYDPGRDRYTLAFRGTDGEGDDWDTNVAQGKGEQARQYDLAYQLAFDLSNNLQGKDLNFTGHSLGGGLATVAALATKTEATIFNAAALHPDNAIRYGVEPQYLNADNYIDHLSTTSDPLTGAQEFANRWSIYGTQLVPGINTEIPDPYENWIKSQQQRLPFMQSVDKIIYHSMAAVLKSIDTLIAKHCPAAP